MYRKFNLFVILFSVIGTIIFANNTELEEVKIGVFLQEFNDGIKTTEYAPEIIHAVNKALALKKDALAAKGLRVSTTNYFLKEEETSSFEVMTQALEDDTIGGVGLSVSYFAKLGGPAIKNTNYLVVSPYATSTSLLEFEPNLRLFSATNLKRTQALEKFVSTQLNPTSMVAIVDWSSLYSKDFFLGFESEFRKRIHLIKVVEKNLDYKKVSTEAMLRNPQVVILPNWGPISASFIKEMTELGYKGIFVGGDSWGDSKATGFFDFTGGVDFKGYVIRQYSIHTLNDQAILLNKEFYHDSDRKPRLLPLIFFESTSYLLNLILSVDGKPNRKKLMDAVEQVPLHQGVLGNNCLVKNSCESTFRILEVNKEGFFPTNFEIIL